MKLVKRNKKLHNLDSHLLIGDVKDDDVVKRLENIVSLKLTKKFYHLCIFFNQLYTNILN
ncbi:MAG: hypothetical protein UIB63_02960 [Methanobrevibacter sp.]|uniref:hypothetical protein n=1 Tax=Methanobrevibacter sp. TaxID=66852 RepID=UPI002E7739A9|nr:hypothetical protein [Methanobrevibacter sp.]MEE0942056.1 hypothetical protein [Methanobrevibacter sp.]